MKSLPSPGTYRERPPGTLFGVNTRIHGIISNSPVCSELYPAHEDENQIIHIYKLRIGSLFMYVRISVCSYVYSTQPIYAFIMRSTYLIVVCQVFYRYYYVTLYTYQVYLYLPTVHSPVFISPLFSAQYHGILLLFL